MKKCLSVFLSLFSLAALAVDPISPRTTNGVVYGITAYGQRNLKAMTNGAVGNPGTNFFVDPISGALRAVRSANGELAIDSPTVTINGDATVVGGFIADGGAFEVIGSGFVTATSFSGGGAGLVGVPLDGLAQSGATANQVPQWNGSTWVPATVSGGGSASDIYPSGGTTNIVGGSFRSTAQGLPFSTYGQIASNLPPTVLFIGDSVALETQLAMEAAWRNVMPYNGAVLFSGGPRNYQYFTTNGLGVLHNDNRWPLDYYEMVNGSIYTWASSVSNGVIANQAQLYFFKSNNFTTLTVQTQAFGGTWATLATIAGDNGGAWAAFTTNFTFPTVTNLQMRVSSDGINAIAGLSIYATNAGYGFRLGSWAASGQALTNFTGSSTSSSNTLWRFLSLIKPNLIIVETKDTAQMMTNGITQLEGIVANSCTNADVIYVTPTPSLDNGWPITLAQRTAMEYLAAYFNRTLVDLWGAFSPTQRSRTLYFDAAHELDSGEYAGGAYLLDYVGLNTASLLSLGLPLLNSGGSADVSGKANLAGGNTFTGTQKFTDVAQYSNDVMIAAGARLTILPTGGGAGNLQLVRSNANSLVLWDAVGNFQYFTISNNSGVLYFLPNDKGAKMMLGAPWPNQRFDTVYATNVDAINLISSNAYVGNMSYATNISGTSPNFTNGSYQTLTTNNAFVWLAPSGINTANTNVQTICIAVTNAAAAMTNMTAPANVHTKGTWWVTNVTKITWEYDPTIRSTNAYSLPLW